MQATRCVYFQDVTTPCNKREPGSGCSAVGGYVRYHAILGASDKCIAVHPSDMAVALAALDAVVVVRDRRGEHNIPVNEFYRLPGDSPEHDTVLKPDQLIVAVELPVPAPAALSTYVKTRDRASFAFALVSVAAEIELENGIVAGAESPSEAWRTAPGARTRRKRSCWDPRLPRKCSCKPQMPSWRTRTHSRAMLSRFP